MKTDQPFQYSIANHARKQHLDYAIFPLDTAQFRHHFLYKQHAFIRFETKTYYILGRDDRLYPMAKPDTVDVLVLSHNPRCRPEEVARALYYREVISDGTCSEYCTKRWRKVAGRRYSSNL